MFFNKVRQLTDDPKKQSVLLKEINRINRKRIADAIRNRKAKKSEIIGLPEGINPNKIKIVKILQGEHFHTGEHLELNLFEKLEFMRISSNQKDKRNFLHILADNSQVLVCSY